MINYNFIYKKIISNYTFFKFADLLDKSVFVALSNEYKKFPFNTFFGQRTDVKDRIFCNSIQSKLLYELGKEFDTTKCKEFFGNVCNQNFTKCKTRIELCNDAKGSYLHNHVDDKAKLFTLQVYLTSLQDSTILNNSQVTAQENSGWFFKNTGTEYHSLQPLSDNRSSIIVNYVNEQWRNQSVLVN